MIGEPDETVAFGFFCYRIDFYLKIVIIVNGVSMSLFFYEIKEGVEGPLKKKIVSFSWFRSPDIRSSIDVDVSSFTNLIFQIPNRTSA